MRRKLTITLLTTLMLLSLWQLTVNVSAQQELTLAKILTGLQTKGNNPETATLAARNVYITKRVQTYGVTFRLTPEFEQELRNAGATTALIAAIRANGPSAPTPKPTPYNNSKPSAAFKNLWVDYGVTEGGQLGMRIHLKFTAYKMKNLPSYLAVYFTDQQGEYLKDTNDAFNSSDGLVAVYQELNPGYDPTDYNDLSVFMPYSELDLEPGNYSLKIEAKLIYKAGGIIQELTTEDFTYKKPKPTPVRSTGSVTAKVNRVWIDYNVTEGGVRGMRIHANFEVTGLKGIPSKLTARVQKENGTFLTNSNNAYSNDDGQLAVSFDMNPGYPTTVYKDADIFLPYGEINIARGKWNLKIDIDLNYDDGTLIQHLYIYDFEFDRP
jgi:hypothetical protein